jgi:iron complex outermembrane receptor protein
VRNNVPNLTGDKVPPRAVLRYKPSAKSSVYASFTLGYKPGLLNVGGGNFTDLNIKPEKIAAYEIGFKYGDRKFSFDTAAYYYDYKNLQVSSYNGVQSILTNAATARIYGIEAQTRYRFDDHFSVNASAAYPNAKYRKFLTAPFYDVAHPDPATGLFPIGDADVSGLEMQHAPKFTASAGAQYGTELARGRLVLSGNLYYTSKFYFDAADEFEQKAYKTLGLRAEWTDPHNRFTVAVFGDNVTDSHYRTQVLPSNFGIGSMWAFPATVAGSLRIKL